MQTIEYRHLKLNDAFQFDSGGQVFVRCRGGFRAGCGGELHKTFPSHRVIKYQSDSLVRSDDGILST